MAGSHRRYNPLLDEWILCSPGRLERPWLGERTSPPAPPPRHDPRCYMCPGNVRAGGERNPDYEDVLVFDNDFPALRTDAAEPAPETHPLFESRAETGECRVLCFSPRHDAHLGRMRPDSVRKVVDAWAGESERLAAKENVSYVQIFENRGAMMGASNPHPHGQIWAVEHVPSLAARKALRLREHHEATGRDLLGRYVDEEIRRDERVVEATDHWVQLVPFWAAWPFETLLVSRRRVPSLPDLDDAERSDLAELLGRLTRRYDALFGVPFPYSMGWYEGVRDGSIEPGTRLHATYFPPLLRSATVRKFVVGYELTAEAQRDLTAEEAAERLRAVPT